MRLLLDTHVFLWWVGRESDRISRAARLALENPDSEVTVSAVSGWEIALKHSAGRLNLPEPPARFLHARLARHGFEALPLTMAHAVRAGELSGIHRDPFDRMIIAQAAAEEMRLVSADREIAKYGVDVLW